MPTVIMNTVLRITIEYGMVAGNISTMITAAAALERSAVRYAFPCRNRQKKSVSTAVTAASPITAAARMP